MRSRSCPNNVLHWPHMIVHTNAWTDYNTAYTGTSGIATAIHVMDLTFIVNTIALNITTHCAMDHDWWQKHTTRTHEYMAMVFTWIDGNDGLGIVELILSCLNMRTRRWMLPHAVGCRNNNWWVWEIKNYRYKHLLSHSTIKKTMRDIHKTGTRDWGWTNYKLCSLSTLRRVHKNIHTKITWHQTWGVMEYFGDQKK